MNVQEGERKGGEKGEDRVHRRQINTQFLKRKKGQKENERMRQKMIENKILRERHEYIVMQLHAHRNTHFQPHSLILSDLKHRTGTGGKI